MPGFGGELLVLRGDIHALNAGDPVAGGPVAAAQCLSESNTGVSQFLNKSRSDEMKVAVAFKPRSRLPEGLRCSATLEKEVQTSLRDVRDCPVQPWDKSHGYRRFSLRERGTIFDMRPSNTAK